MGQTARPSIKRWREHLYKLRKNKHQNRYLQAAWNKYGEKSFEFQVIKEFDSLEELNRAEIETIKNGSSLYNLSDGGNGYVHSLKTKKAIGKANKIPIIGMNVKTREVREYDSSVDAKVDGFDDKCIRKCVVGFVSKRKNGASFLSMSHKSWVWMSKKEATIEKLKERCDIAKKSKVRKERPVIGMDIFTKKCIVFCSASEAGRNGFRGTIVHRACNTFSCVHNGFVWAYGDIDCPQSLLKSKRKLVLSKTRTGPKSWQRKSI